MSKKKNEPKELTQQQRKLKEQNQKRNAEIVCSFMMMSLGFITSPKLLAFLLQKQLLPQQFKVPNLFTYFALTAGFMFILTITITLMRIICKKHSPAVTTDISIILSMNEAMKNSIIYNIIFMGLYLYLSSNWKKENSMLELSPFILFGGIIFDFLMRIFQFLVGAKGFRYLPQSIILFFLGLLTLECFTIAPVQ